MSMQLQLDPKTIKKEHPKLSENHKAHGTGNWTSRQRGGSWTYFDTWSSLDPCSTLKCPHWMHEPRKTLQEYMSMQLQLNPNTRKKRTPKIVRKPQSSWEQAVKQESKEVEGGRTLFHGRHISRVPLWNVRIECFSIMKHYRSTCQCNCSWTQKQ